MKLTRRHFLQSSGAVIAGAALPVPSLAAKHTTVSYNVGNWESIRSLFKLTTDYLHFSSFFISSHPAPVRDAIEKYRNEIDSNPFIAVEHAMFNPEHENKNERVRKAAASYLEGVPEEIVLTGSTTMGLALIYNGLKIRNNQEILTTTHDHYSHHESIRLAGLRNQATVRKISLYDRVDTLSEDSIVERIRTAIQPQTRVLGITWVHSSTGVKLPVEKIGQMLKSENSRRDEKDHILLVVDGVHGLGVEDTTVKELGCDFLSAGTHKWIFGPRGTGIVWGRKELCGDLNPTIPSFSDEAYVAWMQNRLPSRVDAESLSPGGFHAFEHQWAVAEAFMLHMDIGKQKIQQRIHSLNTRCKEVLAKMKHVKLHTPISENLSAGIICFDVEGNTPGEVVDKLLKRRIVASVTPYGVAHARIAPSLVNNEQEVETVIKEVAALKS